ncbi:type I 3-dehydroquinate dehydratase [Chloroflexota bacterium]
MKVKPKICAAITGHDLAAISAVTPDVDLFEARIDLIGAGWQGIVGHLRKPWIACNRCTDEGGKWQGTEKARIAELLQAVKLGAAIIDVELSTENVKEVVKTIKQNKVECLLSFHSLAGTPPLDTLRDIVEGEMAAGADICKVVTTARNADDNLTVLQLIKEHPGGKIVAFAIGETGLISRVFCPLAGGEFTYAAMTRGGESAPGQLTVAELKEIYGLL